LIAKQNQGRRLEDAVDTTSTAAADATAAASTTAADTTAAASTTAADATADATAAASDATAAASDSHAAASSDHSSASTDHSSAESTDNSSTHDAGHKDAFTGSLFSKVSFDLGSDDNMKLETHSDGKVEMDYTLPDKSTINLTADTHNIVIITYTDHSTSKTFTHTSDGESHVINGLVLDAEGHY
jgi:hypothetical protein